MVSNSCVIKSATNEKAFIKASIAFGFYFCDHDLVT